MNDEDIIKAVAICALMMFIAGFVFGLVAMGLTMAAS